MKTDKKQKHLESCTIEGDSPVSVTICWIVVSWVPRGRRRLVGNCRHHPV